jgi:hypothetical protein
VGCLAHRFPSEGVRIRAVSGSPSPPTQWPLMELVSLQSLMSTEVAGVSGYLLPPRTRCFHRPSGFSPAPSPVLLRVRVHPLRRLASPTEYVLLVTCPQPESSGHLPWGLLSSSRQERMKSTYRRASRTRLRFVLSVSHTLDDLLLHTPRGLISSHCHV